MKIVLFELEVIASSKWRASMKPPASTWDEYHLQLAHDKPNFEILEMINILTRDGASCLGYTRRPEKWRTTTNLWMMNWKVPLSWFFMADDKEYGNGTEVKLGLIKNAFTESQRRDILFVVEDDGEMCMLIDEEFGLPTMCYSPRTKS